MSDKIEVKGPSIGFSGLLAILFIGLKLSHIIDWPWVWVLSPLWIPIVVVLSILGFVAGIFLLVALVKVMKK